MKKHSLLTIFALLALSFFAIMTYINVTLPDVKSLAYSNPKSTAFIERRKNKAQLAGRDFHLRWQWVQLEQISPLLIDGAIKNEDPDFLKHDGVIWKNFVLAQYVNLKEFRLKYGASTITQQVAKNLYLSPSKNPVRKIKEWLIAKRLERHLTKERILEIYLNIAELGDGIFGMEAAAQYYYQTSALKVSPREAARLILALPAPLDRNPKNRDPVFNVLGNKILVQYHENNLLSREELWDWLWKDN